MPLLPRRALLLCLPASVLAQPGKTTKLLVGFPPGGGTDAIARLLAERLQLELGGAVIVENKPGAGGQLAAQALKSAAADGGTLFLSHDHSISILPLVTKNPGFDPATDFVPVAGFASFVNAIALSGSTAPRDLPAFIAALKKEGKGNIGVPAANSVPEFLVRALARKHQLDLVPVPYRGSAPMMADMLAGQIPAGTGSVPDFIEQHRAGKLRIVAVMGAQRQALLPQVPTLAELGLSGFEELPYYGLFAPRGTPAAVLEQLAGAVQRALDHAPLRERFTQMGLSVAFSSGTTLAACERLYSKSWAKWIAASGFSVP
jgi:tripartite-type tricarboxylate transporter receptor subunit TctC